MGKKYINKQTKIKKKEEKIHIIIKLNCAGSGYDAWMKAENNRDCEQKVISELQTLGLVKENKESLGWKLDNNLIEMYYGKSLEFLDYNIVYFDIRNRKFKKAKSEELKQLAMKYSKEGLGSLYVKYEIDETTAKISLTRPGPALPTFVKWISEKITSKTEYLKGWFDRGKNSIRCTMECCSELLRVLIRSIYEKIDCIPNVDLKLKIKGHSRGAVAAANIASELNNDHEMQEILFVHYGHDIESILVDPVPGPKNESISDIDMKFVKNVWIISTNSRHSQFFDPAMIKYSNIIIITPADHTAYLDQIEKVNGKNCKVRWHFKNKDYSVGHLVDLPKGIYIDDGNRRLIELNSIPDKKETVEELISHLKLGKNNEVDQDRIKVIYKILQDNGFKNIYLYYQEGFDDLAEYVKSKNFDKPFLSADPNLDKQHYSRIYCKSEGVYKISDTVGEDGENYKITDDEKLERKKLQREGCINMIIDKLEKGLDLSKLINLIKNPPVVFYKEQIPLTSKRYNKIKRLQKENEKLHRSKRHNPENDGFITKTTRVLKNGINTLANPIVKVGRKARNAISHTVGSLCSFVGLWAKEELTKEQTQPTANSTIELTNEQKKAIETFVDYFLDDTFEKHIDELANMFYKLGLVKGKNIRITESNNDESTDDESTDDENSSMNIED